jgi:hypothetical protein
LVPATHTPAWQTSPAVHTSPSSHAVLSVEGWSAHSPVAASQVFLAQVVSSAVGHLTTVAGLTLHTGVAADLSQYSLPLHALPSSCLAQSPSDWHSHVDSPLLHTPAAQASPAVHGLPSSHGVPVAGAWPQSPVTLSQVSTVHGESSLHVTTAPGKHFPPWQPSPCVHGLPSLHTALSIITTETHPTPGWHTFLWHASVLAGHCASVVQPASAAGTSATSCATSGPATGTSVPPTAASWPQPGSDAITHRPRSHVE